MARLADLKKTCEVLHLHPVPTKNAINKDTGEREKVLSISDCVKAIQQFYLQQRKQNGTYRKSIEHILEMESPALALLIKHKKQEDQDAIWDDNNKNWLWQQKLDGCRALLCYDPETGFDMYSRNLSVTDQLPINYGEKILWPDIDYSMLTESFIIDCEILPQKDEVDKSGEYVPIADTQLNLISSILALNEEDSKKIQITNPVKFDAFDIIYLNEGSQINKPLRERIQVLHNLVLKLSKAGVPVEEPMTLEQGQSKLDFYNRILAAGGEGVVVKDLNSTYETTGKRDGRWVKIKRSVSQAMSLEGLGDTIDAFVVGFEEGTPGTSNEGLVSSLKFGVELLDRNNEPILDHSGDPIIHHIATVGGLTQELKEAISTKDMFGNVALKQEIYGKVASIDGQDLSSRNLRFAHAILVAWRFDRSADTCKMRKDILEKLVL